MIKSFLSHLLPQSLFGRVVFLIAILLVGGQFAVGILFEQFAAEPHTLHATRLIAGYINTVTAALETMPDESEADFLDGLMTNEGVRVQPTTNPTPPLFEPRSALLIAVADSLRKKLGPEVRIFVERKDQPDVWVRFGANDQFYYLILPRIKLEYKTSTLEWSGRIAGVGLLSLLGALVVIWHINRPLKELAKDAEQIGRSEDLGLLRESGPSEIRSLARSINGMIGNLSRLNNERTMLLAGVSHDLRTPLARLRLLVELLDDSQDPSLKEAMVQDIEEMDGIIGQFLNYSRGEVNEPAVQGDLNELISEVAAGFQRTGRSMRLELAALPTFAFRPLAMRRVLNNLVDNAFKHGSDEVEIASACSENCITIRVRDRGTGIEAGSDEWLLQPFTRQEGRDGVSGAGLGLAIVNRVVKLHGGRLSLQNRVGGGLEVQVDLPLPADTAVPT